jgi:hypothetical protein
LLVIFISYLVFSKAPEKEAGISPAGSTSSGTLVVIVFFFDSLDSFDSALTCVCVVALDSFLSGCQRPPRDASTRYRNFNAPVQTED